MRTGTLFLSAVQFLFVALLLLVGIFFLKVSELPLLHQRLIDFVSESSSLTVMGYAVLGGAGLFLLGFCLAYRGRYYQIVLNEKKALVDPKLIQKYVENYWKSSMSAEEFNVDVRISSEQKIEVNLKILNEKERDWETLLSNAEKQLALLFHEKFGYAKEFYVSVCFQ